MVKKEKKVKMWKKFKSMFEDDDEDNKIMFKEEDKKNPIADKRLSFLFDDD